MSRENFLGGNAQGNFLGLYSGKFFRKRVIFFTGKYPGNVRRRIVRGTCADSHAVATCIAIMIWATLVNARTRTALDQLCYKLSQFS